MEHASERGGARAALLSAGIRARAALEERDERPLRERAASLASSWRLWLPLAVIAAALAACALTGPEAGADPADRWDGGAELDQNDGIASAVGSTVAGWIAPALRGLANMIFDSAQGFLGNVSGGGMLGATFGKMFEAVSDGSAAAGLASWLHGVQASLIVPYASLVLTVFLVVSIASLLSTAGTNECRISVDRVMMIFVGYTLASLFVQNSWEIMALAYDIVAGLIRKISYTVSAASAVTVVPEDYSDIGGLMMLIVAGLIVWLISIVVAVVVQFSVVARGLQIYVMTTLAPISLAFMGSDSARNMGTGFLKRWFATLLAGVIMALLLGCMSYVVGNTGAITAVDTSDVAGWVNGLVMTLPVYISIAFAMAQSGAWARELVGV